MQPRFKSLILIFFLFTLCLTKSGYAQLNLSLENQAYGFTTNDYYIQSIEDTRISRYFLGKIFQRNGRKVDLTLQGGTERAFASHLEKNLLQDGKGLPLIVKIVELSFIERNRSGRLVTGSAKMELEVYSIFDGDTALVCSPKSSTRYQVSLGTPRHSNYEPILRQMWISAMGYLKQYVSINIDKLEPFNTGSEIMILPYSRTNNGDTIQYHSRKVTWNDFNAEPRNTSKFAAAIFPTIGIQTKLTVRKRKLVAIIEPQVYMLKNQSWAKNSSKTPSSLEHEQIHFDLAKVGMKNLVAKLKTLEAYTMDDLSSMIQFEYLQAFRDMNRMQEAYDNESDHNLNKGKQVEWAVKVRGWLKE